MRSPFPAHDKPKKEAAGDKGSQRAGIYFNAEASAKDVGLPIYPGVRPHQEKDDDSTSAKFGLWGSSFASKLAVVKLQSSDWPQKGLACYKKALARYGTVVDCGTAAAENQDKDESESSNKLTCEGDKPDPGKMTQLRSSYHSSGSPIREVPGKSLSITQWLREQKGRLSLTKRAEVAIVERSFAMHGYGGHSAYPASSLSYQHAAHCARSC